MAAEADGPAMSRTESASMAWVAKVNDGHPLPVASLPGHDVASYAAVATNVWRMVGVNAGVIEIEFLPGLLRAFTPNTTASVSALTSDVEMVRGRGYPIAAEEFALCVLGDVIPITGGRCIGATVWVALTGKRTTPGLCEEFGRATAEVSQETGQVWPDTCRCAQSVGDARRPPFENRP